MNFEDLTEKQQAMLSAAKTPEDILAIAREEGYKLSAEELAAVSGGEFETPGWSNPCPQLY